MQVPAGEVLTKKDGAASFKSCRTAFTFQKLQKPTRRPGLDPRICRLFLIEIFKRFCRHPMNTSPSSVPQLVRACVCPTSFLCGALASSFNDLSYLQYPCVPFLLGSDFPRWSWQRLKFRFIATASADVKDNLARLLHPRHKA